MNLDYLRILEKVYDQADTQREHIDAARDSVYMDGVRDKYLNTDCLVTSKMYGVLCKHLSTKSLRDKWS